MHLDGPFWITAVTSLKCLSEGLLRGSGLGQCLHWHLHSSPHRACLVWASSPGAGWDVGTSTRQPGLGQVVKYDYDYVYYVL